MRFVELGLEKFGVFEQRVLNFGAAGGLTVVFGGNETGKSTSLTAIADFLFGVPHLSPHSSIFGADAMRINAVIKRADGQELNLRRRKGRSRTLTDAQGIAVEETVLTSLLGGTSRERFETLFGLDHHRLRYGGAQLLTAEGDIGRLIVEAGGGLRGLVERLAKLDEEVDLLFDTRRSEKRAFYRALDAFDAADRSVKEGIVSIDQYEKSRRAHEETDTRLESLTAARSAAAAETARLERLVRVAPILRSIDQVREQIAAFAELPELPLAFDQRVTEAMQAQKDSLQAVATTRALHENLAEKLSALAKPSAIGDLEVGIREATELAVHVAKAREDRPARMKELADSGRQLDSLRLRLKLPAEEDLGARLPPPAAIELVRELATLAQRREPTISAAAQRVQDLEAEIASVTKVISDATARGHEKGAGVAVAELAALPGALQGRDQRRRAAEEALVKAQTRALGLGYGTLEMLELARFPSAEVLVQEGAAREALGAERLRLITQRAEAERVDGATASEIARLTEGAQIASDSALANARQQRTEALAPLRTAHLTGQWTASQEVRQAEVDGAEGAIYAADEIADRHAAEAQRAAALAQAVKQRKTAIAEAAAAGKALAELDAQLQLREQALTSAFPQVLGQFPQLSALKAAQEERSAILRLWADAQELFSGAQADEAALTGQLQLLDLAERACKLSPGPKAGIAERVRASLMALSEHEQAHTAYRRDLADLQKAHGTKASATNALKRLQVEAIEWQGRWVPALKGLGLQPDTDPDQAAAAAMEWASAKGVFTTIETTQRRLDRMAEDEAALQVRVAGMGASLSLTLPENPVAAAKMLEDRWRDHEDLRRSRERMEPDVSAAVLAVTRAEEDLTAKTVALEALGRLVGQTDLDSDALRACASGHAERRQLRDLERTQMENLATAGDGKPESELRAGWADRELDALQIECTLTRERAEQADADRLAAFEASLAARTAFETYQDQVGVNRAVIARESATAELHQIVERYVDLSLARDLIRDAIDRVRSRQQDPLVARAGTFFRAMTRGAYQGVGADIDAKGDPMVVGQSATGGSVAVAQMSDGTRDQLYLAFRLAGVESYCAAAEPLPFIADDILVHFDDPRSAATLEVLAAFGTRTQVLLFTHHESVRQAAKLLGKTVEIRVVDID